MSYNLEQFKDGLKELQIELNEKQISQFLKYYEIGRASCRERV